MKSIILDYLGNNRLTRIHISAEFIGGGLVFSWWLFNTKLLDKSHFRRSVCLGYLELRTQVSSVQMQTQLRMELPPMPCSEPSLHSRQY